MGQSINVLLYGVRIPDKVDVSRLIEAWEVAAADRIAAYEVKLRPRTYDAWLLAHQAYVPLRPNPCDVAAGDNLIGFYICRGWHDDGENHRFPAMTFAEMRSAEPTATIIKRCRRRWSRFARWARWLRQWPWPHGVELGKPRIWRTRTEVA